MIARLQPKSAQAVATSKRTIGKVRARGLRKALIHGSPHPWTNGNAVPSVVGVSGNTVAKGAWNMSGLTKAGGHGGNREPINVGQTNAPEPMINHEHKTASANARPRTPQRDGIREHSFAFPNARSFREHTVLSRTHGPCTCAFLRGFGRPSEPDTRIYDPLPGCNALNCNKKNHRSGVFLMVHKVQASAKPNSPKPIKRRKAEFRTRATTKQSIFFDGKRIDGRSMVARRLGELYELYLDQFPGEPTAGQDTLIRRAANLTVMCELREMQEVCGEPVEPRAYSALVSQLSNTLKRLGLVQAADPVEAAKPKPKTVDGHTFALLGGLDDDK